MEETASKVILLSDGSPGTNALMETKTGGFCGKMSHKRFGFFALRQIFTFSDPTQVSFFFHPDLLQCSARASADGSHQFFCIRVVDVIKTFWGRNCK